MTKLQKKPSALKRGHPTLQNMNFYKFFPTFVGHFGCGSESSDPYLCLSDPEGPKHTDPTDPDPKKVIKKLQNKVFLTIFACTFVDVLNAVLHIQNPALDLLLEAGVVLHNVVLVLESLLFQGLSLLLQHKIAKY
jgi:hypothetical protein